MEVKKKSKGDEWRGTGVRDPYKAGFECNLDLYTGLYSRVSFLVQGIASVKSFLFVLLPNQLVMALEG